MVEYPIRKETGRYWSVTGEEGSEHFHRGLEALRAIRRAFTSDKEWDDPDKTGLKEKYKFQDSIEDMLKNPGSNRDNPRYTVVKNALSDLATESGEKADALEEAALMVLGVLRRRRGSEAQIARMGERRLEQRREARNILTQWQKGEAPPRAPKPVPPRPPPRPPLVPPTLPPIPPPPVPPHEEPIRLIVNSEPFSGITFVLDGNIRRATKSVMKVTPGMHIVTIPWQVKGRDGKTYTFQHWQDSTPDPRNYTIDVNQDTEIIATYGILAQAKKEIQLIIESMPMKRVQIKIFTFGDANSLTEQEVITRLGGRRGTGQQIYAIIVDFRNRKSSFSNNREKAKEWLESQLSTFFEHPGGVVEWILEREFDPQKLEAKKSVLEGSGRWRPRGANLIPVKENLFTDLYITLESGQYRIWVPPEQKGFKFVKWEIRRTSGGITNPVVIESSEENPKNETDITLNEPVQMIAYYTSSAEHKRYGGALSPYAGGVSPESAGGKKDAWRSALAMSGVRGKISREVKQREFGAKAGERGIVGKQDPFILSIINKGKRILNGYAKAEYSRIFDPLRREYDRRGRELRAMQRAADNARRHLRREIRRNRRATGYGMRALTMRTNEDTMNLADQLTRPGNALAGNVAFTEARDRLREYLDARDKYYEDFKRDLEGTSAHLRTYLEGRAGIVAVGLTRRARMPLNSADQKSVEEALKDYAGIIAEDFATRGRTMAHGFMRGLGMASRSLETGGAAITNVFVNLFTFITGPWTLTTLFALLEFFFVLTYVGYNIQILWIFPTIAAVFTFILNFSDSFQPLDWITHLSSGAIIGYSSALLLVALGAPGWGFIGGSNTIGFWMAWGILGFIGLFQFYQTGGFKVVLQVGVLVLLLSYLALGPYQAYFHSAIGQVKAPVEIAYRSVSGAVTDVWLLATNPTEWYARQQLVNVRAERPLDLPKGVEITSLEALPPSVPAGQQFALATVIRNDGILPASDIILSVGCNQWCNSLSAAPTSTKSYEDAKSRLDQMTVNALDSGSVFYIDDRMERKEGQTITFTPLVAKVFAQSVAQTNIAKITFNLSYAYSTNSSLQVDVINENELERRFREGETVFKPVVAVDKGTPARLSLNVGPQPLRANTNETIMLVSISNTRDSSKIVLPRGTIVTIKMPKAVGSGLECGPSQTKTEDNDYETVDYKIEPTSLAQDAIEVLPYDFNSIFAFICKFTTKDVDTLKSGFITAELPRYIFRIEQKKDVFITPTLGIVFEPYEATCNTCGKGVTNACEPDECHKLTKSGATDSSQKCYYEGAGKTITQFVGTLCHTCGSVPSGATENCGKFISQDSCEKEDSACGWSCVWNKGKKHPVSGVEGTCEKGEIIGGTGTDCTNYGICTGTSGSNSDYNAKSLIKTAADQTTADPYAIGAIMHQESGCGHYLSNGHVKCGGDREIGLMQMLPSTAQSELGNSNLACDPQQNVVGGAKYILSMRNRYLRYRDSEGLTNDEVWQLAFAAYNTGPGNVDSAISRAGSYHWSAVRSRVAAQTQTYVDNVFPAFNSPTASNNCYA